jgi:alkylated DNA nucleotide flippase Atl1
MKEQALNIQTVIDFMDNNPDRNFRYGDIAEAHGKERGKNGQAVGQIMKAICRRGRHDLCVRVVNEFGRHQCQNPLR